MDITSEEQAYTILTSYYYRQICRSIQFNELPTRYNPGEFIMYTQSMYPRLMNRIVTIMRVYDGARVQRAYEYVLCSMQKHETQSNTTPDTVDHNSHILDTDYKVECYMAKVIANTYGPIPPILIEDATSYDYAQIAHRKCEKMFLKWIVTAVDAV